MQLSVVIITKNEEANLPRTLASVKALVDELGGEIIVVDSGSTDRTREIAESFGARVFIEEWKGFAAQKNSAIAKAQGAWVLSLDADEEVDSELACWIRYWFTYLAAFERLKQAGMLQPEALLIELGSVAKDQLDAVNDACDDFEHAPYTKSAPANHTAIGLSVRRKNLFLGKWIRFGGFYPDEKLRLFRRSVARVEDRAVHETFILESPGETGLLRGALIHHAYPTLDIYLEHMRRYAALGGQMIAYKPRLWLWLNRWCSPPLTFFYNYLVRLGFLDGREGLLLHWHHARYVSWKYKAALAAK